MAPIDWKFVSDRFFFLFDPFKVSGKKDIAFDIWGGTGHPFLKRRGEKGLKISDFYDFLPFLGHFFWSIFQKMDSRTAYGS